MGTPQRDATLIFLLSGEKVLLGMKKRGFGKDRWNGYGGKPEDGESVREAALRELAEETDGVTVRDEDLIERGYLDFHFSEKPAWDQRVHLYSATRWTGKPTETEEMLPRWFSKEALPFDEMWVDDRYWLPQFLAGERIEGRFVFGGLGEGSWIAEMEFFSPAGYAPTLREADTKPKP